MSRWLGERRHPAPAGCRPVTGHKRRVHTITTGSWLGGDCGSLGQARNRKAPRSSRQSGEGYRGHRCAGDRGANVGVGPLLGAVGVRQPARQLARQPQPARDGCWGVLQQIAALDNAACIPSKGLGGHEVRSHAACHLDTARSCFSSPRSCIASAKVAMSSGDPLGYRRRISCGIALPPNAAT